MERQVALKVPERSTLRYEPQSTHTPSVRDKQLLMDSKMLAKSCKRAGDTNGTAKALYRQGIIYDNLQDPQHATGAYLKSLQLWSTLQDRRMELMCHNALGVDYQLLGPAFFVQAEYCHLMFMEMNTAESMYISRLNLCLLQLSRGNIEEAKAYGEKAIKVSMLTRSLIAEATAISTQSLVLAAMNDYREGTMCIEKAIKLYDTAKDLGGKLRGYINYASILSANDQHKDATTVLDWAVDLSTRLGDTDLENRARTLMGVISAQAGMHKLAVNS